MDYPVVMREVWSSLNHAGKNWRIIYKVSSSAARIECVRVHSWRLTRTILFFIISCAQGLVLLEALIKNGSERCVNDARDHVFRIRTLTDFTHTSEGRDQGAGIREKAKQLVELLGDTARIREQREASRKLRDKYIGMSNVGLPASLGGAGGGGGGYGGSTGYSGRDDNDEWSRDRGHAVGVESGGGGGERYDASPSASRYGGSSSSDPAPSSYDNSGFPSSSGGRSGGGGGGTSSSGGHPPTGRRGRRPQGGAQAPSREASPQRGGGGEADEFENAFGGGGSSGGGGAKHAAADDFDAFGAAPAPPPRAAPAPAAAVPKLASASTKLNVQTHSSSGIEQCVSWFSWRERQRRGCI